jgi:hypothetical protein
VNSTNGFIKIIDDESNMIDVNVVRLELPVRDFEKANVKLAWGADDTPPGAVTFASLLYFDPEKPTIEVERPLPGTFPGTGLA